MATLNGRPVIYDMQDDAWTPETTAQVAAKLVNDEQVVALVGNMSVVDCATNEALHEQANILVVAGVGVPRDCFHSKNYAPTNMGPRLSIIGAIADL